jgi:hypothetical protein
MRTIYLTSLSLFSLVGFLGSPATAATPQVKFSSKHLSPTSVKSGASVLASVKVTTKGGATVSSVSLRIVATGKVFPVYTMDAGSGGKWSKRFPSPSNFGTSNLSVAVWADAQTSLGVQSVKLGTLKIRPTPVDPNSPPPPPPI